MRFLIDEMLPPAAASMLRASGHDAVHVCEVGLVATEDSVTAETARAEQRALVTENVSDFVMERDVVMVFVSKRDLPQGGRMAPALATLLDRWAQANPSPYLGSHWPTDERNR